MKFIDLFAGIGGFRLALEQYGCKCVFSSEIDKFCCETYMENFGDYPSGDITKIDENDIPDHDILCGGFPCQPFSISGKQLGFEDTRGTLFFDIIRIIKVKKPKIVFLENVANLTKHNESNTIDLMVKLLDSEGYNVNFKVLNASDYGVPQNRKRVYFVCFRKDLNVVKFDYPKKHIETKHVIDILECNNIPSNLFVDNNKITNIKKDYTSVIDDVCRIGTINKGGQGDRIYSIYGFGITLSAMGGGTCSKTGGYLINNQVRKLTIREAARMQGFPEEYKINANHNQAYKQFGNSVAVPVLKDIVGSIGATIKKIETI